MALARSDRESGIADHIALKFESALIGYQHRLNNNNIFIIIKSMDTNNTTKCMQPGRCSLQKLYMNPEY